MLCGVAGVMGLVRTVDVWGQERPNETSAAQAKFDVWEFQVEGATLIPRIRIEKAVYPFLGPQKTIEAVERARTALQNAYRDAGFATVVVDIPEQQVSEGVVRLRVTESKVGTVRVTGSRYYSQGRILAQVPSVAPGMTPNFAAFQSDLQSVNRFPGSRVTPILKPGRESGTTDVELNVEDKNPLSGSLELNKHHSPNPS